ncbi:cytochrome c [Flavobacteriaceae bacterium]|jgi:mono/diheme cytochrome c family protein|nr:cytochrome c [Flavobacteriaceae bacterium]CAI8303767.1 MAG: Cytochrome c-552 [uncultured Bacteroidetes bacterium]|tara:strand:+ start:232 stop:645 length:414 start_codon:yes stop_codon:yes gene_type:complete
MRLLIVGYLLIVGGTTASLYQEKTKEESIVAGEEIYQDFCLQCHLTTGAGVSGVFPPLKDSDYLMNNIDKSIAGIKFGLKGEIVVNDEIYDGVMAKQGLDDEEIADVMNYILNQWGNSYDAQITTQQVSEVQKSVLD